MLSKTAQYALCAVVYMAEHPDGPQKTRVMAQATGAPASYLATVLKSLARARLLKSQAGPTGGYCLAIPADQLTMLDVIDAADPMQPIEACPFGNEAHRSELCPVHRRLNKATSSARSVLGDATIADLILEGDCFQVTRAES